MKIVKLNSDRIHRIGIRLNGPSDIDYILSNWFRRVRPCVSMSDDELNDHKRDVFMAVLRRCGASVACHPSYPEQIFGFAIGEVQRETPVVHFVFVKGGPYRRCGIATAVLQDALGGRLGTPGKFTYQTRQAKFMVKKWNLEFDPYRVAWGDR